VPKIQTIRIIDLARAIGRASSSASASGGKDPRIMCPSDDSHLTVEFPDHFVITPSIQFHARTADYTKNMVGEVGAAVKQGFEYNSGSNPHFLKPTEILEFNAMAEQ
jgi:UDP-N-acetylglucosamine 4,6-dehydratase